MPFWKTTCEDETHWEFNVQGSNNIGYATCAACGLPAKIWIALNRAFLKLNGIIKDFERSENGE